MSHLRLVAFLALTGFVQPVLAQSWERHVDDGLGFSIELPTERFER